VNTFRIALANIRFPSTADESIALAKHSINQASAEGAEVVCFPECFVPGYRVGKLLCDEEGGPYSGSYEAKS
jgi:predicted amidohydrolase